MNIPSLPPSIIATHANGVAEITFNRPDKLNSFTRAMHGELRTALDKAHSDRSVRAVLITGAGRGFCAGQDLEDVIDPVTAKPGAVGNILTDCYHPLIHSLQESPLPVICAVNGVAAGAGANIALACDIVLAARSASFIQAFVKIGLVPDAGGSYVLPRLIGVARAKEMLLRGKQMPLFAPVRDELWRLLDERRRP